MKHHHRKLDSPPEGDGSSLAKGKARQLEDDDTLSHLNQLLEALHIPISIPDLTIATPSLLLAVLESVLERRFLDLEDPSRLSRSSRARSKCLKILLKILDESLDARLDRWSSDLINLNLILQSEPQELAKLIDGLLKLARRSNNPALYKFSDSTLNHHTHRDRAQKNSHNPSLRPPSQLHPLKRGSSQNLKHLLDPVLKPPSLASRIPSTSSASSRTSQVKDVPINSRGSFASALRSPLAQSSPKPLHRPSSSMSLSSTILSRSLNLHQQRQSEHHVLPTTTSSNPPTLRDLLGPLKAQLAAAKRPQTLRTTHHDIFDQLQVESHAKPDDRKLNLDRVDDSSEQTQSQEESENTFQESRYQYARGLSMMTLDGIEDDDPFVSMDTRKAMESLLLQKPEASYDRTQLAVVGDQSGSRPVRKSTKHSSSRSHSVNRGELTPVLNNLWTASPSTRATSVYSSGSGPAPILADLEFSNESLDIRHIHQQGKLEPSLLRSPSGKHHSDLQFFTHEESRASGYGFGQPPSLPPSSPLEFQIHPSPPSIPLPASPPQRRAREIRLASEGARLDLICSDVLKFEKQSHDDSTIEGWQWLDLTVLSQEAQLLQPKLAPGIDDRLIGLMKRKLELLKALRASKEGLNCKDSINESSGWPQVASEENHRRVRVVRVKRQEARTMSSSEQVGSQGVSLSRFKALEIQKPKQEYPDCYEEGSDII